MKIYDISQEVFACEVYPGDPKPQRMLLASTEKGNVYNLTAFSMCAHNGTHIDAPFHFLPDGKTVDMISPEKTVGYAFVTAQEGILLAEDARLVLQLAAAQHPQAVGKILIKGNAEVSLEAAEVFAAAEIDLLGVESQSVGPVNAPMAVHRALLGADVVLLEGIRLRDVPCGVYWLNAIPLNLDGSDGAPCRATLVETS